MPGVVVFDPVAFAARYPQFTGISAEVLQSFFDEATLLLNNSPRSLVRDTVERGILLSMITAHIGTLSGVTTPAGQGSTAGQVGRVSSASEGSVSASLDMGATYGSAAWFMQSQYGATYWQMTAKYRTMRYIAPRRRCR